MIIRKNSVPMTEGVSSYPDPYNLGRGYKTWRGLSDAGGLTQYGANLETLKPGATSSQMHWESHEDEFLYMLEGEVTVIEDGVETVIGPGDACAWKAGSLPAHQLRNHTDTPATYLIVGTRVPGNVTTYPGLDMTAQGADYFHLDGRKYPKRETKE